MSQPLPRTLNNHVARSATLVAAFFAIDKVLGIVRDATVSRAFGTSADLDAYYAAFELPDALFNVVAGLATATALIPVLSAYTARDDREGAWSLVSVVINWALIIVSAISVAAAIIAPSVIRAVAPGFGAYRADLATHLMRLVLLQTVVSCVSGIVMSALQAHRHFLLPAIAPLSYTVGRIVGARFLAPTMGIYGLAWGGLAGTVGHLVIQVPGLLRYHARWYPRLRHPDLPAVLKLMGPRVMGLAVTYLNFVLPTYLGSRLTAGAISSYEYGWRLMQFPETIIGTALGLTVFPTLSQRANVGDREGLRATAAWALRLVLGLAIPAAVGLIVLGRPLTAIFFQRGAFDAAATESVYCGLQAFALGLIAHSALEVTSRLFYAQRDMWTPFWAATAGFVTNFAIAWALLGRLAHVGMALANSLGVGLQVVVLLIVARKRLRGLEGRTLGLSLARTLLVSAVMGGAVLGFSRLTSGSSLLVSSAGGLAVGTGAFLIAASAFGSCELRQLPKQLLYRR